MDWKKYWNNNAQETAGDTMRQVQRRDIESTLLTVDHIIKKLNIQSSDEVLDVCCGNGILTQKISEKCNSIIGVDHSEELLKTANQEYSGTNISYIQSSATNLSSTLGEKKFDKIYLQFSFQYFDKKGEGEKVISEMLKCLKPKGEIFIGDITNFDKLSTFYYTTRLKFYYYRSTFLGTNTMGKFWKKSELDTICKKLNVKGIFFDQPEDLPYSYYRFDYLIKN
ncbi:class I SAM-dependent methyltransferase [Urechidicola croceus]|uniref:Methyltransferase domain-containing protein n=1 Tax=Urechidicola croceus TaxID=1850246 RepID=A0A1D8P3S7_9FLAO|nr:class I SAM-dependent methyltransferase [Urechidicola croceus]AOW19224.1 hypothetical protein LPB138_00325 [Urechidicola croceus]